MFSNRLRRRAISSRSVSWCRVAWSRLDHWYGSLESAVSPVFILIRAAALCYARPVKGASAFCLGFSYEVLIGYYELSLLFP